QRRLHKGSLADGRTLQLVVGPVPANGLRSGDEGGCEPTERAVVLTRFEHVQLRAQQRQGQWQAVATDRLRQADHVGVDPGLFEAEEPAGTSTAGLDVVDDEQDAVFLDRKSV